jgi:hypothetical protein
MVLATLGQVEVEDGDLLLLDVQAKQVPHLVLMVLVFYHRIWQFLKVAGVVAEHLVV